MKLGKLLKIAPCEICLYVSTSNDIFDDDYTEVFVGNYTKVPEHFLSRKDRLNVMMDDFEIEIESNLQYWDLLSWNEYEEKELEDIDNGKNTCRNEYY